MSITIRSFILADESWGLKTIAEAIYSRTGLPVLTYSVEECALGSTGLNSGELGLRLDVVDSVTCGDVGPPPDSSWVVNVEQILVWCFP